MFVIMKTALKERMRRKELYIIVVIGALLFLLCSSDSMTIKVEGETLTGFDNMFMILHTVINAIGCILGVVLSLHTIPNEYERRNSHLIWVRGISQCKYHAGLTLANMLSSIMATYLLYIMLMVYILIYGDGINGIMVLVGFLLVALNVGFVSMLASALTIILPSAVAGTVGLIVALFGVFHSALEMYKDMVGGIAAGFLNIVLKVIPDLHSVQMQAQNLILGKNVSMHAILITGLGLCICLSGVLLFRKKEA